MTFAKRVLNFYKNLAIGKLPSGIEVMNPFKSEKTFGYVEEFFGKYFSDANPRTLIFGINPGRFGAGITGINFTDPVTLRESLGIKNDLGTKRELSADFVHKTIAIYGGPKKFYKDFFLTSFSPLGFTKMGKNYNFYDDKELLKATTPFIIECTKAQIKVGGRRDVAIILGTGKNQKFFNELNKEYKFFKKLYALEHPRFIMQYRRKGMGDYIKKYIDVLTSALVE